MLPIALVEAENRQCSLVAVVEAPSPIA